jgi:hypothetical protein
MNIIGFNPLKVSQSLELNIFKSGFSATHEFIDEGDNQEKWIFDINTPVLNSST